MVFRVKDPISGGVLRLTGGEPIRSFLARSESTLGDVEQMCFSFVTTKTTGRSKVRMPDEKSLARSSTLESQLLDDFCEWMLYSGVLGSDEVFTRYATVNGGRGRLVESSRKVLTRREVNDAIKGCAVRCGLPGASFSSKSLRSGASTQGKRNGDSDEQVCVRGGWARGSRVPANHYIRDTRGGVWAAVSDEPSAGCFTQRDVEDLLPLPSDEVISPRDSAVQRGTRGGNP